MAGVSECGNEISGSIKCGEFLDWLRNCQLLKRDSIPLSWLIFTSCHPIHPSINTFSLLLFIVTFPLIQSSLIQLVTNSSNSSFKIHSYPIFLFQLTRALTGRHQLTQTHSLTLSFSLTPTFTTPLARMKPRTLMKWCLTFYSLILLCALSQSFSCSLSLLQSFCALSPSILFVLCLSLSFNPFRARCLSFNPFRARYLSLIQSFFVLSLSVSFNPFRALSLSFNPFCALSLSLNTFRPLSLSFSILFLLPLSLLQSFS